MDIDYKIVVSNFHLKVIIGFGIVPFLLKPVFFAYFYSFLDITQQLFNILKTLIVSHERMSKGHSESFSSLFDKQTL